MAGLRHFQVQEGGNTISPLTAKEKNDWSKHLSFCSEIFGWLKEKKKHTHQQLFGQKTFELNTGSVSFTLFGKKPNCSQDIITRLV